MELKEQILALLTDEPQDIPALNTALRGPSHADLSPGLRAMIPGGAREVRLALNELKAEGRAVQTKVGIGDVWTRA